MTKKVTLAFGAFVSAALVVLGVARDAAALNCEPSVDGTFLNRVYVSGSAASRPLVMAIATDLAPPLPITIFYQSVDSCSAANDLFSGQGSSEPGQTTFYGGSTSYVAFDAVGAIIPTSGTTPCIPSVPPIPTDIAISDAYYETCAAAGTIAPRSSAQKEILGPIQAMTFAAPLLSTATAISAEAAYVVFGYGASQYVVEPWDEPTQIFTRPPISSVQMMLGAAIGLQSPLWTNGQVPSLDSGVCTLDSNMTTGCDALMEDALTNVPMNQTQTIGSLEAQEVTRYNGGAAANKLKILAYQHTGQPCGYLPDSTASSKDKLNVRQGRYAIWGPLHLFFNVDANGNPLPGDRDPTKTGKIAAMTAFLNYFASTGPSPSQTFPIRGNLDTGTVVDGGAPGDGGAVIDGGSVTVPVPPLTDASKSLMAVTEAQAGLVPWCAMQVVRTSEIGPEASFQPREPCTCAYANAIGATLPLYCVPCLSNADCVSPYPACRVGYCEIQ